MQFKNKKYADERRRPQVEIKVGDRVLVKTHILSNANQAKTSKFVSKRDGPYIVVEKKGSSSFVIADEKNANKPIATLHVSDITLFDGPKSQPIYPMRKRGRPKQKEMASNSTSNNKQTGEIDESLRTSRKKK